MLIIEGSGSGKTNALRNIISRQPDIDKIYLYAKDPHKAKHQLLFNNRQGAALKYFNDFKTFIEYLNDIDDIYENNKEYNANKKPKVLIVFGDTIADILSNEKHNPIVTELFIRGEKLNISLVCITKSYFVVPKNIRLNSAHCFIMKALNKEELQKFAFNRSSDIDFEDFMNLYKNLLQNHILF